MTEPDITHRPSSTVGPATQVMPGAGGTFHRPSTHAHAQAVQRQRPGIQTAPAVGEGGAVSAFGGGGAVITAVHVGAGGVGVAAGMGRKSDSAGGGVDTVALTATGTGAAQWPGDHHQPRHPSQRQSPLDQARPGPGGGRTYSRTGAGMGEVGTGELVHVPFTQLQPARVHVQSPCVQTAATQVRGPGYSVANGGGGPTGRSGNDHAPSAHAHPVQSSQRH